MTRKDIRKALVEDLYMPKEVRTNDGARYLIKNVEYWMFNGDQLLIVSGGSAPWNYISMRDIASIGPVLRRRRA